MVYGSLILTFFSFSPATGHVLWANDYLLDLLGYSREEYIGHKMSDVSNIGVVWVVIGWRKVN